MSAPHLRILIAEDQPLVRMGLKMVLQNTKRFEVAEAEDGKAAIDAVAAWAPHVVLMDLRMPGVDGIQATEEIHKQWPEVKVIILTSFDREEDALDCFAAGADGYVLKDTSTEQLVSAIESVHDGACWLDRRVAERFRSAGLI